MNHYKDIALDYANNVEKYGFKDSQQVAPLEYLNDDHFIVALPLWLKNSPEFERLQRIYK